MAAARTRHLAAELIGRYLRERQALAAIALTANTSCLTAIGNDYSYEAVFSRQIEAIGNKGDIAIGISTSGNSKNVLQAPQNGQGERINYRNDWKYWGQIASADGLLPVPYVGADSRHPEGTHPIGAYPLRAHLGEFCECPEYFLTEMG